MTGEKNKAVSLEKFWKLDDEQLSTPRHDEMVITLIQMTEGQLKELLGVHDTPESSLKGHAYELTIPPQSEVPVLRHYRWDDTGYIIGYWDLVIEVCKTEWAKEKVGAETVFARERYYRICIEVKPVVDSFGKVLRQLQTYDQYPEYEDTDRWGDTHNIKKIYQEIYLYTTTKTFDTAFNSQRIHVIHPVEQ